MSLTHTPHPAGPTLRARLLTGYYAAPHAVRRAGVRLGLARPDLTAGTPEPGDRTVWQTLSGTRTIVRDDALAARWRAQGPVYLDHGPRSRWWELDCAPGGALTWPVVTGRGDPLPWALVLELGDPDQGDFGPIRPGPAWLPQSLHQQVTQHLTPTHHTPAAVTGAVTR